MKLFSLLAVTGALFASTISQAALPAAFHNVPSKTVEDNLNDFSSRGLGPRSISIYTYGQDLLSAGVFDHESSGNIAGIRYANDSWGRLVNSMAQQGYQLRELTVALYASRLTAFGGIFWKPTLPTFADHSMTDAKFGAAWQEWVVNKGYRIADYVTFSNKAYGPSESRRHGAVFVKDGKGFYFFHGLNPVQFAAKNREMSQKGFLPDTLNISNTDQGEVYSAIYTRQTGGVIFYYNMLASEYQATFNEMGREGYRLKKVFGYRNSERFAAIWVK